MTCLFVSVQNLLGKNYFPISSIETFVASVGIFMGAIINANIFGELAVILASMGKDEKLFQWKLAITNTAMINLELPEYLQ